MSAESTPQAASGPVPEVSVVIATHREKDLPLLLEAIGSVAAQTIAIRDIVVAVDHNPALADRLEQIAAGVTVVRNDGRHRGASATRNAGARICRTDIIAFLDDDEVADADWLSALLSPLERVEVVGSGGRYVPRWLHRRPSWFPDELAWAVGAHHSGMPTESAVVRNVWSGNMAVKTEVFRSVGGFRESFGKSGGRSSPEDTDLCIRMAAAHPQGAWIYQPHARIHHAVPRERSTFSFYLGRCFAEGRGKIYLRELLPEETDVLNDERSYLLRTIPMGILGHLRLAVSEVAKAIAVVLGVGSAAVGAAVSAVEGARGRTQDSE